MMSLARAVLLAALLGTSAAEARDRRYGGANAARAALPGETGHRQAARAAEEPPEAQAGSPVAVGMTVPESVELWSLPQDSVTEVPATTSYKFLLTGKTIAVVDPESRKVIQIIPN